MFCALSGAAPEDPVVNRNTGHLYERRIIVKHIEDNGTDPFTNEPLKEEDLLPIQGKRVVRPRPPAATSIPAMIQLFQNEWDAVMLESFQLKQQLDQVRQELSHALYQHDAACRVIARLVKERDAARAALATAGPGAVAVAEAVAGGEAMETEDGAGITPAIVAKMTARSKQLSKGRKHRPVSASLATPEQIETFGVVGSHNLHSATPAGVTCLDINPRNPRQIITGGVDKKAVVFDLDSKKIVAELKAHTKRLTSVVFHPTEDVIVTTSQDKSARIWALDESGGYRKKYHLQNHTDVVVGATIHATGDYLVTASHDKTWVFWDIASGRSILQVGSPSVTGGYTCTQFHPDGLILGTGTLDSLVRIWDVKSQNNLATFEGHTGAVKDIAFSENGYYLATSAEDNTIKLWDLRYLTNFRTIPGDDANALAFDYSGKYLVAAGSSVKVYTEFSQTSPEVKIVKTWDDHTEPATDVAFGPDAQFIATTSMDRSLKIFGNQ